MIFVNDYRAYVMCDYNSIYHFGTDGMKWGRRRYQNEDGSYKPGAEGRYYDEVGDKRQSSKKDISKNRSEDKKGKESAAQKAKHFIKSHKKEIAIGAAATAAIIAGVVVASKLKKGGAGDKAKELIEKKRKAIEANAKVAKSAAEGNKRLADTAKKAAGDSNKILETAKKTVKREKIADDFYATDKYGIFQNESGDDLDFTDLFELSDTWAKEDEMKKQAKKAASHTASTVARTVKNTAPQAAKGADFVNDMLKQNEEAMKAWRNI